MKKFKLLLIFSTIYFLSGCTIKYDLVIDKNSFEETVTVNMNDTEYTEFSESENNKYINMYYDDENNVAEDYEKLPIEGVKYYDFKQTDKNQVRYFGKFSYDRFDKSTIISRGYNKFDLIIRNDEMHIYTTDGFTFLHDNLSSVQVTVKSIYDLLYSNADVVSGDLLIWNITRENADMKNIEIHYDMNKENPNIIDDNTIPEEEEDLTQDNKQEADTKSSDKSSIVIVAIGFISFIVVITAVLIITKKKM